MAGLFDAFRRDRRPRPADLPHADGPAREVLQVVPGVRTEHGRRFLPVDGCDRIGALVDLAVVGPTLIRPGEAPPVEGGPVRRMTQMTALFQGSIEHRDSLGHRGLLRGPAVRLVSGGAGLLAEAGLAREVRRDGGDIEMVTAAWTRSEAVTPTVRLATSIPERSQGRSRMSLLVGPQGAAPSADGLSVMRVSVAAGATVDLPVPADADVVVVALSGAAIIGDDQQIANAGQLAVLGPGTRVTVITRLEDSAETVILLLSAPRLADVATIRRGDVVADDDQDLAEVDRQVAEGAFGRLPRLDG